MLERRIARRAEEVELRAVVDRDELLALQRAVEDVHVAEPVGRYIVAVAAATRASGRVQVGASPRGTLALMKLARARAALAGRDYVVPDDVKALAVPALAHRLVLNPELWVRGISGDEVVRECLEAVPAPDPADGLRSDDASRPRHRDSLATRCSPRPARSPRSCSAARRSPRSSRRSLSPRQWGRERPRPGVRVGTSVTRERVLEGETLVLDVHVRRGPAGRVARAAARAAGGPRGERAGAAARRSRSRARRSGRSRCRSPRAVWGAYRVGEVIVRAPGPLGVVVREGSHAAGGGVRVLPSRERLRRLVGPARAQAASGSRRSPDRGEGIEFADLRPFAPGDRVRRVNWRATARRGAPVVTDRHPERNADVVLFLDTFAEARRGHEGTLVRAVRAADSLASAHLAQRDRVGLVAFGGVTHWLLPSAGTAQLERIADALLRSEIVFSYVLRNVEGAPAAQPAAARARHRDHAAARRAHGRRARRPARAAATTSSSSRSRPRRSCPRRATRGTGSAGGCGSSSARALRAAVRGARRAGRDVGRRGAARGGGRGGDGVAAARAARASRLAAFGLAVLAVAGAIAPAGAGRPVAVAAGAAGLVLLALAFALRRAIALDAALLALAAACAAALDGGAPAAAAPAYGAALLTAAQLGHRAIELRTAGTIEAAALIGWLVETAALAFAALAASAVVLLAADAARGGGTAARAAGAVAAAATLVVLVMLARRVRSPG